MLSVVVLVFNDQDLIKACLESVKWSDEIIVVDQGSTDQTLEIVKKYPAKIIVVKDTNFSVKRNKGMEAATGDWVLYVDSDERVLEPLKTEILEIIKSDSKAAYAISRKNIIFGELTEYGPFWPDWIIRLFKKSDFEQWTGAVHESPQYKGQLGYTKSSFLHLTHRNLDQVMVKNINWSRIDSKLRFDAKHPPMSSWRFLRILVTEFWYQGVVRKGWFSGTIGVIDSTLQVFFLFMTYVRLWEMQQKMPIEEVYHQIDQKLIESDFSKFQ